MKFCEQMCPFFLPCEIREPENGEGLELTVEGAIDACKGREYLLDRYHINCKHLACKTGEGIAKTSVDNDKSMVVLVAYWSTEKGKGRFVDRLTGEGYSTNQAGDVLKTGQVIEL